MYAKQAKRYAKAHTGQSTSMGVNEDQENNLNLTNNSDLTRQPSLNYGDLTKAKATKALQANKDAKQFKPRQDEAPLGVLDTYGVQPGFMMKATTDSPPSCSLTASPEKTTEKKLVNITSARDKTKMAASRAQARPVSLNFACADCSAMHKDSFIPYRSDPDLGNCELCGTFYNLKAARLAAKGV
jgi:hypothetical protein